MGKPISIDLLDIDIAKSGSTIHRSFINKLIGEGDVNGNGYGVRIFNNGQNANLDGCTCIGYFVRPDGETTVISGTISGNTAYVVIPQACYVQVGNFSLSIKIVASGFAGTMRIVDGTITDTSTDTFVDPGSVIPDLASWTALVASANTAATNIGKIHIESELIEGTRYKMKVYKDS